MKFLILTINILFFTNITFAGNCDCSPEISNASAVVSSTCGKIWSNGHCTLKESGVGISPKGRSYYLDKTRWEQGAFNNLPAGGAVNPLKISWPQKNLEKSNFYKNFYPKLTDIGYLEKLITETVQPEISSEFVNTIFQVMRHNKQKIVQAWSNNSIYKIEEMGVIIKISDYCIYAGSSEKNFYINTKLSGNCNASGK